MCHIFFSFFCCVLVGCLVSYCAYFLSLVFSLYYNFFSWKNFISGKLCANIAPQFYSFPQNILKWHEPKHLANGERNNNLQNGQKIVVTPYLHSNLKPIGWNIWNIKSVFSASSPEGGSLLVNDSPSTTPNLAPTPPSPLYFISFFFSQRAHM